MRAATAQARTDLGVQLISSRYTSDIADVLVKSLSDPDSLTKSERFKLKSFFSSCATLSESFLSAAAGAVGRVFLVWCGESYRILGQKLSMGGRRVGAGPKERTTGIFEFHK